MNWKEDYRIGIGEIDEQHKAFVACMASIELAVARFDREAADAAVVRLADLASAHFTLEEILMRILDYPGLAEHVDDHKRFSIHLGILQERFLTTDAFRQGIEFLHRWWERHVQEHDKSYALHFLKFTALGKA